MLVFDKNPDIIAISETLPKNCSYQPQPSEFNLAGYEFFSNMNSGAERGVALYIKSSLKPLEVKVLENKTKEAVWAQIRLCNSDTLLVGSVYRSPNSSITNNENFNSMLQQANSLNYSHVLIMGDCNRKEINWEDQTTSCSENHEAFKFLESYRDSYLFQHCRSPTHYRNDQTPNVLDLIFTNEEGMINEIHYCAPVGKSHHLSLWFQFRCYKVCEANDTPSYVYDKGDYNSIRDELKNINWESELRDKNTEESWCHFKVLINRLVEKHILRKNTKAITDQENHYG